MLEELKNLNYAPTKSGLTYFLSDIIGQRRFTYDVITMLCAHAPEKYQVYAPHIVAYSKAFKWLLEENNQYEVAPEFINILNKKDLLNDRLISETVESLFEANVLTPTMFSYELALGRICFKNEMFPLEYSSIRNTLTNQGFFLIERTNQRTNFFVASEYRDCLSTIIKKQKRRITLSQLKNRLERNEEAGEKAEQFVLGYEQRRLPEHLCNKVQIISGIDVTAGYDILSFDTETSTEPDRFIEVKAIGRNNEFFWSKNEYEVALLKGTKYYLYLVKLEFILNKEYSPIIIKNPAYTIMESDNWLVETQSYRIKYVNGDLENAYEH